MPIRWWAILAGWHSYHLLRTKLAPQEGIDFVAYARPGAEQPDSAL